MSEESETAKWFRAIRGEYDDEPESLADYCERRAQEIREEIAQIRREVRAEYDGEDRVTRKEVELLGVPRMLEEIAIWARRQEK